MPKLHELLAVEDALRDQSAKVRGELAGTFEKKRNHFIKRIVTFEPVGEGKEPVTEDQLGMETTVPKEIEWITGHLTRALDAANQIDEANTRARADVVLDDGTTLLKNLPATQLMQLAKRLQDVKMLAEAIPTLDPARGFEIDAAEGKHVYRARLVVKERTAKVMDKFVAHEGNDKHPPQVQVFNKDVITGHIKTQEWSGLITTAAKAEFLDRVEQLLRAVKRARSRANEVEVDLTAKIGATVLNYVFQGKS